MKSIKINIRKFEYILLFIFLFLAAMNFFAKFFYFIFAAFAVIILLEKKIKVDFSVLPYVLLGLLMGIYNADEGFLSILRCLAYALSFIIGSNLVLNLSSDCIDRKQLLEKLQKTGYALLAAICWGSFVHFMLNFVVNQDFILGRNTNDIWTGERLSATIQAAIACLMSGFAVSMVIAPMKKFSRFIGIIAIIGIMAYNLMLAGRTLLFMVLLIFMIGFVFFLINMKSRSKKVKTLIIIVAILLLLILLFAFNIGGVQEYFFESNLFLRFDGVSDSLIGGERFQRKYLFLQNVFKYPFGGLHMREQFGFAHDLLFDGYDEYGFVALLFLLIILVSGIKNLIRLCKNKDFDIGYKLGFLCVYISILLEFCVEPIFEGVPWLFVCYCLLNGCIDCMNKTYFNCARRGIK